MVLQAIDRNARYDALRNNATPYADVYPSPDGKFVLHLTYAGEYPHGDSWHYAAITDAASGQTIWTYTKGDPIRGTLRHPWSADSKSCYFTIINLGDRIMRYDTTTGKLITVFGSKVQNRLKGIGFVPRNFNGVVFYDNIYDAVRQYDVYCYLSDTETLVKINDEISDERFLVGECGIANCVLLVCEDNIKIYDPSRRRVVKHVPVDNNDLRSYRRGYVDYLHKNDAMVLTFLVNDDWKYYKLHYR